MDKLQLKFIMASFCSAFVLSVGVAQTFEGTIELIKVTPIDTVNFIYYIKNDNVRIDEIGFNKKTEKIILINTSEYKAVSLNPDRQLLVDIDSHNNNNKLKAQDINISKGKKTHLVEGYKCEEWTVTKKNQNLQVTYYIAKDNFNFFEEILNTLNNKDKLSLFYQQLPDIKNTFPFYAVESDLQGNAKTTLKVVSISKATLSPTLFDVPESYIKFEK